LNNCDSDQDTGKPDHADAAINGPEDLEDLAIIKLARIPDLPEEAQVSINVDEVSRSRTRLFIKTADGTYRPIALIEGSMCHQRETRGPLGPLVEVGAASQVRNWGAETRRRISEVVPAPGRRGEKIS
jgi:hypothetical protein